MTNPLLGVAIITYNRVELVRELLVSLVEQTHDNFQLAILDNGSDQEVQPAIADLLSKFRLPPIVKRVESNRWSAGRVQDALGLLDTEFAVLPGDDDVALPNFIEVLTALASADPSVTIASASATVIDGRGRETGEVLLPAEFESKGEALGRLLCGNAYALPSTAFRRVLALDRGIPRTMTSLDWWLWIRGWLTGTASVSRSPILKYRRHPEQQQHWYGRSLFALDGMRMILSVLDDPDFTRTVESMPPSDRDLLIDRILNDPNGMNIGQGSWWPIAQVRLADVLAETLSKDRTSAILSQASVQLGAVPPKSSLAALTDDPTITGLPSVSWARLPIAFQADTDCLHVENWGHYLGIQELPHSSDSMIVLSCGCDTPIREPVTLSVVSPAHPEVEFRISLPQEPSDNASAELRFRLGEFIRVLNGAPALPRIARAVELLRIRLAGRKSVQLIRKMAAGRASR